MIKRSPDEERMVRARFELRARMKRRAVWVLLLGSAFLFAAIAALSVLIALLVEAAQRHRQNVSALRIRNPFALSEEKKDDSRHDVSVQGKLEER